MPDETQDHCLGTPWLRYGADWPTLHLQQAPESERQHPQVQTRWLEICGVASDVNHRTGKCTSKHWSTNGAAAAAVWQMHWTSKWNCCGGKSSPRNASGTLNSLRNALCFNALLSNTTVRLRRASHCCSCTVRLPTPLAPISPPSPTVRLICASSCRPISCCSFQLCSAGQSLTSTIPATITGSSGSVVAGRVVSRVQARIESLAALVVTVSASHIPSHNPSLRTPLLISERLARRCFKSVKSQSLLTDFSVLTNP